MDYLKGFIWIFCYISFLYVIGTALFPKKSAPYRFLGGYFLYLALLAVVGIPLQMFRGNWKIFFYYQICLIIILLIFAYWYIKKKEIVLFEEGTLQFIKTYWFVIVPPVLMIFVSLFYNHYFWFNESADGGFYLTRMASIPYISNPFGINPSVGNTVGFRLFGAYTFSTFELNASFFIYCLDIMPTIFARCFLSMFNYFVYACSLYCLTEVINEKTGSKIAKLHLQYFTLSMLIFSFCARQMLDLVKVYFLSGWAINVAMYYGSMIVRTAGLIVLLLPILDGDKPNLKNAVIFFVTSFALFSQSPTALPFIASVMIGYIFVTLRKNYSRELFFVSIFLFVLFNLLIKDTKVVDDKVLFIMKLDMKSFLPLIFIIGFYYLDKYNDAFKTLTEYLIIFYVLIVIEPFNFFLKKVSGFSFVLGRYLSSYYMLLLIISVIVIMICLYQLIAQLQYQQILIPASYILLALCLTFVSVKAKTQYSHTRISSEFKLFLRHHQFANKAVVKLGYSLNGLSKKHKEKLIVAAPYKVGRFREQVHDGYVHTSIMVACSLRQFAPDIISLNGLQRYPDNSDPTFEGYDENKIKSYHQFIFHPSKNTFKKFKQDILEKYPINCIVTINKKSDSFLKGIGYKLINVSSDHEHITFYTYCKLS